MKCTIEPKHIQKYCTVNILWIILQNRTPFVQGGQKSHLKACRSFPYCGFNWSPCPAPVCRYKREQQDDWCPCRATYDAAVSSIHGSLWLPSAIISYTNAAANDPTGLPSFGLFVRRLWPSCWKLGPADPSYQTALSGVHPPTRGQRAASETRESTTSCWSWHRPQRARRGILLWPVSVVTVWPDIYLLTSTKTAGHRDVTARTGSQASLSLWWRGL